MLHHSSPFASPPHRGRRSRAPGFTLTELLIVIAIIAILTSLSYAGLSRAKQVRGQTKCAANLRSISAAVLLYSQDNDTKLPGPIYSGVLPYYHDYAGTQSGNVTLIEYIAPYLSLPKPPGKTSLLAPVLVCETWVENMGRKPVEVSGEITYITPNVRYSSITPGSLPTSDTSNFQPFGYPPPNRAEPLRVTQLYAASRMAMVYDADKGNYSTGTVPAKPVHFGKRNYAFFDGHVETRATWP